MNQRTFACALLAPALLAVPGILRAETLLVLQGIANNVDGYNLSSWTGMTSALNEKFGATNITVNGSSLDDLAHLETFDSLMLAPDFSSHPVFDMPLLPTEIADVQAYIATGRRVLLVGENGNFSAWDKSILEVVGGTFGVTGTADDVLTPVVANSLTAGVTSLSTAFDGVAVGGASLFSANVATLWPGSGADNVLTLLSANVEDDFTGSGAGNMQFKKNLADWLAGSPAEVPEPSAFVMLGASAALWLVLARKRQ